MRKLVNFISLCGLMFLGLCGGAAAVKIIQIFSKKMSLALAVAYLILISYLLSLRLGEVEEK